MDLDRVTVGLRPRGPWEGIDLGFAMARTWFKPLCGLWLLTALPSALLALILTRGQADWWVMLVWWFKPLYEAPMVWWVSRALFGETPRLSAPARLIAAGWTRRLLPYLLWRRLSPRRSLHLPVVLLEGQHGAALRARRRLLDEGAGAAWLTLILVHFEYILWGGALLAIYFLTIGNPVLEGVTDAGSPLDLEAAMTDPASWAYWLSGSLYLAAAAVIAPFYVCGGFALYVGRRTELEAWDLELAFRRAAVSAPAPARVRAGRRPSPGPVAGAALVLCFVLLATGPGAPAVAAAGPQPVAAASAPAAPRPGAAPARLPDGPAARALIGEVLADPDFGAAREQQIWVWANEPDAPEQPAQSTGFEGLGTGLALVLRVLLVLAAVAAVALLVRRVLRDWRPPAWRRGRGRVPTAPVIAVGRAPDPQGAGLAAAVRALLAAGDGRAALALLYRGAIAELIRRGLPVPDAATEGECLALAAAHLTPAERAPFERLTRDWRALAYAGAAPDPARIGRRLTDWLDWCAQGAAHGATDRAAGGVS